MYETSQPQSQRQTQNHNGVQQQQHADNNTQPQQQQQHHPQQQQQQQQHRSQGTQSSSTVQAQQQQLTSQWYSTTTDPNAAMASTSLQHAIGAHAGMPQSAGVFGPHHHLHARNHDPMLPCMQCAKDLSQWAVTAGLQRPQAIHGPSGAWPIHPAAMEQSHVQASTGVHLPGTSPFNLFRRQHAVGGMMNGGFIGHGHHKSHDSRTSQDDDQILKEPVSCEWTLDNGMVCDKMFDSMDDYVKHVSDHASRTSKPNHICMWADCTRERKPFKAFYMLTAHIRTHTGERPHQCTYYNCNKTYRRLENLRTHLRTHTGDKPFVCQIDGCDSAFTNTSDRAKHEKRTHSDQKPFACHIRNCTKAYTDPSSRRKHMQKSHPNEYAQWLEKRRQKEAAQASKRAYRQAHSTDSTLMANGVTISTRGLHPMKRDCYRTTSLPEQPHDLSMQSTSAAHTGLPIGQPPAAHTGAATYTNLNELPSGATATSNNNNSTGAATVAANGGSGTGNSSCGATVGTTPAAGTGTQQTDVKTGDLHQVCHQEIINFFTSINQPQLEYNEPRPSATVNWLSARTGS